MCYYYNCYFTIHNLQFIIYRSLGAAGEQVIRLRQDLVEVEAPGSLNLVLPPCQKSQNLALLLAALVGL